MIALVGYGYWGKNLARVFKDKLKYIIDKDDSSLNKAKYTYGKDVYYDRSLTNVLKTDKSTRSVSIPFDESNRHYQEYLAWVAEGNTADPAD